MNELWKKQFGEGYAIPEPITQAVEAGLLIDESWHNDMCPSFSNKPTATDKCQIRIWVEHPDPSQREHVSPKDGPTKPVERFSVLTYDLQGNYDRTIIQTDDLAEALKAILPQAS
jgi:hypothetical protein